MANEGVDIELQAYEAAFQAFDHDESGTIDIHELKDALLSLGHVVSLQKAQQMIAEAEIARDGELDFEEFIDLIESRPEFHETVENTDELIEAFKSLDKDGSGYLDQEEFKEMLESLRFEV